MNEQLIHFVEYSALFKNISIWLGSIITLCIAIKWLKTWKESLLWTSKIKNIQELLEFVYIYEYEIHGVNEKEFDDDRIKELSEYIMEIKKKTLAKVAKIKSIWININYEDIYCIILIWFNIIYLNKKLHKELNKEKISKEKLKQYKKDIKVRKSMFDEKIESIEIDCKKILKKS